MLLFIGFNRIWHFVYDRSDEMLCGFFRVSRLPEASTKSRCTVFVVCDGLKKFRFYFRMKIKCHRPNRSLIRAKT